MVFSAMLIACGFQFGNGVRKIFIVRANNNGAVAGGGFPDVLAAATRAQAAADDGDIGSGVELHQHANFVHNQQVNVISGC